MNNLICPFCLQDISVNNHNWDCQMNPVNINNNEFQFNKNNNNNIKEEIVNNQLIKDLNLKVLELLNGESN